MTPHPAERRLRRPHAALLLGLLLSITAADAASADDVVISADRAVFRQQEGYGLYEGHAELVQGERTVTADRIELRLHNGDLQKVVAYGNPVELKEGSRLHARGKELTYDVADQRITLSQDAYIRQDGRTFEGGKVVYDLATRNVEASGNRPDERVRIVIPAADTQPESSGAARP